MIKEAIRLNPLHLGCYFLLLGFCLLTERYEEVIEAPKRVTNLHPRNIGVYLSLTTAYSMSGQEELPRAEAAEVPRIDPRFSKVFERREDRSKSPSGYCKKQADMERYYEGLREAGLK